MTQYATGYQPISAFCDDEGEDDSVPPQHQSADVDPEAPPAATILIAPDKSKGTLPRSHLLRCKLMILAARWNHINDLDEFFSRVYQYHQRSGFFCMVLQDVLQLM
jgi:hypothetical protein